LLICSVVIGETAFWIDDLESAMVVQRKDSKTPSTKLRRAKVGLGAEVTTTSPPTSIHHRHLPTCEPFTSPVPSSKSSSGVEVSKRFSRDELEDAVRRNNAEMAAYRKRNTMSKHTRGGTVGGGQYQIVDATAGQLKLLDVGVKLCARKYNDAKADADRLEEEVKSQSHVLIELIREANALDTMMEGKNEDARKVTGLVTEIQDANECSDEILHYRHQLNHVKHRLWDDSESLENELEELSGALATAAKEQSRCQKMLAELESGLVCASIALDETIRDTTIADEERNQDLAMKQIDAKNAGRMEEWNRKRLESNLLMHASLGDATNRSERERLKRTYHDRGSQMKDLRKTMAEKAALLLSLEESFAQIEQGTGVNSIDAMVQKMTHHEEGRLRLVQEKKDVEEKLKGIKESLMNDMEELSRLKTNGLGTTEISREIVLNIEESIACEKANGKIAKSTQERLESLLVGIRQGVIGLYTRLLPFDTDGQAPHLEDIIVNSEQAASDTMEMISFNEKILGMMVTEIGGIHFVEPKAGGVDKDDFDEPAEDVDVRVASKVNNVMRTISVFTVTTVHPTNLMPLSHTISKI
jgi:hypothetical protein